MSHQWDEFSKSLAEPVPRRESLRRLGAVLAGAVLGPLGLQTALASGKDPCKAFCRCRKGKQQNACLAACRACNNDPGRLCGSCGGYVCCGSGRSCCGNYECRDLANDVRNCGACNHDCWYGASANEEAACFDGACVYACVEGTADCGDGTCTPLQWDPDNCGACGHVCGDSTPVCDWGTCWDCESFGLTTCSGLCTDVLSDSSNCGACGFACGGAAPYCSNGECIRGDEPCPGGGTRCNGVCTNINFDTLNCGGCGIRCSGGETTCSGGVCQSPF